MANENIKRCLTAPVIRNMQIKTIWDTTTYKLKILFLIKQTDHNKCWQKCGGTEHSFTAGVNVKWFNRVVKWFDNFIKLNIYLPCDPTSPPLGILQKKKRAYIYAETFTWMFIALFAMGKHWKQYKYPSTNRRRNKLWYILAKKILLTN